MTNGRIVKLDTAQGNDMLISSLSDLTNEFVKYISRNPQIFCGADIYNITFETPPRRAGALATVLLLLLVDKDRKTAVRKCVIIAPPLYDMVNLRSHMFESAFIAFEHITRRDATPADRDWIRSRLQLVLADNQQSCSVLDIISAAREHEVVIVMEAAIYRDGAVSPHIADGFSGPRLTEDYWVPQLHSLASKAIELAKANHLHVALDTDRPRPGREALIKLLDSIDNCGLLGTTDPNSTENMLADKVDEWEALIRTGRLGQVLREIDELTTISAVNKTCLRIQVFYKAQHAVLALQALRELISSTPHLDQTMRVRLARIARSANANRLATEILTPCVDELNRYEDLESALQVAHEGGLKEIEERVAAKLEAIFPESQGVRRRQLRALEALRDYKGIAAIYRNRPENLAQANFYEQLAVALSGTQDSNYLAFIATARDFPENESFRMACASDALFKGKLIDALNLATPIPVHPDYARQGEALLLDIIMALFLSINKGGTLLISYDQLSNSIYDLIVHLAAKPNDAFIRFGLDDLLHPSISGDIGISVLAYLILKLTSQHNLIEERRFRGGANAVWIGKHTSFFAAASEWLERERPVILGRISLPESLLTEDPDHVVSAVGDYMMHASLEDSEGNRDLYTCLTVAMATTQYCSDPDYDLQLLQLASARFANLGNYQAARDLAQQAIQISDATPRRRRLGWFVLADTLHRCHNHRSALLALACALSADTQAEAVQVWAEIFVAVRIFRDCRLYELARNLLHYARQVEPRLGRGGAELHRLDGIELQLRYFNACNNPMTNSELEILLDDFARNGEVVLETGDMTEPSAAMLGQLIRHAKSVGATVSSRAERVFSELSRSLTGFAAERINSISAPAPTAEELLGFLRKGDVTRYSDDVGYDMHNIAGLAKRSIANEAFLANAVNAWFALELLSDRGVGIPHWDEAASPPVGPISITEPAEIACELSREGLGVLQVGFDIAGKLVKTVANDGILTAVRESEDVTAEEKFHHWAAVYPFNYGIDETTANLFFVTTQNLVLPTLPEKGPVLIIADVAFQPFPPNLLADGENLAGRIRPMAAAPSLLWLKNARSRGANGDGRLCAWISTAVGETGKGTLQMILRRLESTFQEYGFTINTDPALPHTFARASLAVVTAHGGVHPDNGIFQNISDEGRLLVSADELANSLRNIDVVILFVCSGGRADKHPEAVTSLGLAKQILDRGCSAVIASPWPLDPAVPCYWLPMFLSEWSQGKILMEANFAANQVVDRRFARDAARGLAMTVLGNPGLRWPKNHSA